ncbi:hypothetical protein Tco_0820032 [Tanacetum coccineum]|uniref:Uncharacterized protein n=1 Tax=Tanacetum coccineum TaxID=301880 RepID=A0ABQ5ACI4_9ASTR
MPSTKLHLSKAKRHQRIVIGQDSNKNDTRDFEQTHLDGKFYTKSKPKEAQGSDIRNATPAIRVITSLIQRFRQNVVQYVGNSVRQNAVQNQGIQNVRNQNGLSVISEIANQHGSGNVIAAWTEGNGKQDVAYLQKLIHIAQKEEAGIQLTYEEFDLMAAAGACEETERVNTNCTLEITCSKHRHLVLSLTKLPSMNQMDQLSGGTVDQNHATAEEIHAHFESLYNNLAIEVEKVNQVNRNLKSTNADLTTELARYKTQQKQQSLYNAKVLLEKHDPLAVYDSEETLELAQESRLKMKQLNKEIKPSNYTKINHLSGGCCFSNNQVT